MQEETYCIARYIELGSDWRVPGRVIVDTNRAIRKQCILSSKRMLKVIMYDSEIA